MLLGGTSIVEAIGPFHSANGAAFNTFTTKKDVSPQPLPVVLGGKIVRGTKVGLYANGEFSTTGTPTINLGFWFGTRAGSITGDIALSSSITTGTGAAAWPWIMEWEGFCNGEGTAGTLIGQGKLYLGTSLTAFATPVPIPITQALRTVTIDTTIERAMGVSGTWGTSSASNQIIVNNLKLSIY